MNMHMDLGKKVCVDMKDGDVYRLYRRVYAVYGQKTEPPHGGFESRFKFLYVESTSTIRTKLLNLRVNLRVDS